MGRRDGEAHEYLRGLRERLLSDKRAGRLARRAVAIVDEAARLEAGAVEPLRATSAMAQREAFSDRVLELCLADRHGGSSPKEQDRA